MKINLCTTCIKNGFCEFRGGYICIEACSYYRNKYAAEAKRQQIGRKEKEARTKSFSTFSKPFVALLSGVKV